MKIFRSIFNNNLSLFKILTAILILLPNLTDCRGGRGSSSSGGGSRGGGGRTSYSSSYYGGYSRSGYVYLGTAYNYNTYYTDS